MTTQMAERNSPHRSVGKISTPTLVIHGDKDYRVPIGEGLRLWFELLTQSGLPAADDGTSPFSAAICSVTTRSFRKRSGEAAVAWVHDRSAA